MHLNKHMLLGFLGLGLFSDWSYGQSNNQPESTSKNSNNKLIIAPALDLRLINSVKFHGGDAEQGEMTTGKAKFSYALGAYVDYELLPLGNESKIDLTSGLLFSTLSFDSSNDELYIDPDDLIVKVGAKGKFYADFFEIPIWAKYHLAPIKSDFKILPYIIFGPTLKLLMSASFKSEHHGKELKLTNELGKMHTALSLGGGSKFEFGFGTLGAGLIYHYGLSKTKEIHYKTSSLLDHPWDFKISPFSTNTLSLNITYDFKL